MHASRERGGEGARERKRERMRTEWSGEAKKPHGQQAHLAAETRVASRWVPPHAATEHKATKRTKGSLTGYEQDAKHGRSRPTQAECA